MLLDIVDGVPYLVVYGQPDKNTEKIYGCPDLPYVFLKYEKGFFGKWILIPVEQFPSDLRDANLSVVNVAVDEHKHASRDEILWDIRQVEQSSGGRFQAKIPRGYDTWHYGGKNGHKNDRKSNDCRPPRQPPEKMILPPTQEVALEILETKDYTPEWVANQDEWTKLAFNKEQNDSCNKLFKPADPDDRWMGERFAKDSTGQRRVPYGGYEFGGPSALRICEKDNIWFVTHIEEPGKMVMTKYTATGDLLYRISFKNPEDIKGYTGFIVTPSFRPENGYLNFDWRHFWGNASGWRIKRSLKVRLPEPKINVISTAIGQNAAQVTDSNKAKSILAQPAPQPDVKSFRDCPSCPEMIVIPGKNFAIGKYEVTQAEWKAIMKDDPFALRGA